MVSKTIKAILLSLFLTLISFYSLSSLANDVKTIKVFPLDSLNGVITKDNVQLDKKVCSDKKGSLKITVTKPTTIKLFEVSGLDVDNAKLLYQAKVKTQGITGKVYLEMWCHFAGKGEYFSKGLNDTATSTTDWSSKEIPFLLKAGQKPDLIKLNLVIDGKGTAWIDDIKLLKAPLK